MSSRSEAPLAALTLRGGAYLAARYGLGVLVSLGNMLVLTWWIGPHAYGLFVTTIALTSFLANLARAGVDTYLVRQPENPDAHLYSVATTVVLANSLFLMTVGAAAAPWLIRWFGSREFLAPYLVLLLNVPMVGLTGIPMAKLERALNFGAAAGIELGGQILALIVSMTLAAGGFGIWAPVSGQLAWQAVVLAATCVSARLLPHLRFDRPAAKEMLAYGIGITASIRVWQLRTLVNPLLVGRFVGAEGVAFVGVAVRIAEGLGSVRMAAGRIAIAALARLQQHHERMQLALQRALCLQLITLGPLLCTFALLGPWIVPRFLGARWMPSLTVFPFIAVGVLVNSVYNLQSSALFVMGRPWVVTRACAVHVVLLAGGSWVFLRFGISGYGWAELLACAAYIVIHAGLSKILTISYRVLGPWLAVFTAGLFARGRYGVWALGFLVLYGAGFVGWQVFCRGRQRLVPQEQS